MESKWDCKFYKDCKFFFSEEDHVFIQSPAQCSPSDGPTKCNYNVKNNNSKNCSMTSQQ